MSVRILPSNPQSKNETTADFLRKVGEGGVTLSSNLEKSASKPVEASMEKEAVTKEQQAEYWREYFANAGLSVDFEGWMDILFG